jgi:hypothetical protein
VVFAGSPKMDEVLAGGGQRWHRRIGRVDWLREAWEGPGCLGRPSGAGAFCARAGSSRREGGTRRRAGRTGFPSRWWWSLTSFPPRFGALARALDGLLLQTVRPDATILWLAPGDADALPPEVRAMERRGLTVAACPDWRSYKKVVPALLAHPEAGIATADDDLVVPATWLEELEAGALEGPRRRGGAAGAPDAAGGARAGGALRRLGQEHPPARAGAAGGADERDRRALAAGAAAPRRGPAELFTALAPSSDDLWLWWMLRLGGGVARKVGGPVRILEWEGTQGASLRAANLGAGAGNDRAAAALAARYGLPSG